MRKIQIIGLALVAIFAFSAIAAASAFAAPEWLFNGATFTGKLPVLSAGTLLLEDMKGGLFLEAASVVCSGLDAGTVTAPSSDEVTEITEIKCTNESGCPSPSAKPVNLPWTTSLSLATDVIDTATNASKEIGWTVACTGIADKCVAATGITLMENNTEGVTALFNEGVTEPANCERGGALQGLVVGEILFFHHEGVLSISGE